MGIFRPLRCRIQDRSPDCHRDSLRDHPELCLRQYPGLSDGLKSLITLDLIITT